MPGYQELMATRTALDEFGYQEAKIRLNGTREDGSVSVEVRDILPPGIRYMVAKATVEMPCWSCWAAGFDGGEWNPEPAKACLAGGCKHPEGPATPPEEYLIIGPGPKS